MKNFWSQHWFLTTLAFLIATGLTFGLIGAGPAITPYSNRLNPRWITAGVLFLMAYSLDSGKLWAAFRAPLPVVMGFCLNFGFLPLAAWGLSTLQLSPDLRIGMMIAATVPCTTAAASVMTRKAGGNDAVSLLTTLSTNLICFLLTPLWLKWTTSANVEFDPIVMMVELMQAVLLPTALGQSLRLVHRLRDFATRRKNQISIVAQVLIELMVFSAALRAGDSLHQISLSSETVAATSTTDGMELLSDAEVRRQTPSPISATGVGVAWVSCAGLHLVTLGLGWSLARLCGVSRPEQIAVAFAGSQKTLPIGIYVANNAVFATAYPFAMFPMLLFHTSQLFLDTAIASRLALRSEKPAASPASFTTAK